MEPGQVLQGGAAVTGAPFEPHMRYLGPKTCWTRPICREGSCWHYITIAVSLELIHLNVCIRLMCPFNLSASLTDYQNRQDGQTASLRPSLLPSTASSEDASGQATVVGMREYSRTEAHTWIIRFEQAGALPLANFLVGLAPPGMDVSKSLGEEGCGIGLDFYG